MGESCVMVVGSGETVSWSLSERVAVTMPYMTIMPTVKPTTMGIIISLFIIGRISCWDGGV